MRTAENRHWILRSTNDGITATIDSAGRLRGTLDAGADRQRALEGVRFKITNCDLESNAARA